MSLHSGVLPVNCFKVGGTIIKVHRQFGFRLLGEGCASPTFNK